jgi:hypothetical protein
MIKEFKMIDISFMSYYQWIDIKQGEDGIFVSQEKFTKEILKKFKVKDCVKVNTLVEYGMKSSNNDE